METPGFKKYVCEDFSISYPANWEMEWENESTARIIYLPFSNGEHDADECTWATNLMIDKKPSQISDYPEGYSTPGKYSEHMGKLIGTKNKSDFSGPYGESGTEEHEALSVEFIDIDRYPAILCTAKRSYEFDGRSICMMAQWLTVYRADKIYKISAETHESEFRQYKGIFSEIFASFRFTNRKDDG